MSKRLNADAAQELIERGLATLGGKSVVAKAKPVIEAALEVARLSSHAAGERKLPITGISVHSGEDVVFQVSNSSGGRTPVDAKKQRIPIAFGGTHYTCWLIDKGPPPLYFCIYF